MNDHENKAIKWLDSTVGRKAMDRWPVKVNVVTLFREFMWVSETGLAIVEHAWTERLEALGYEIRCSMSGGPYVVHEYVTDKWLGLLGLDDSRHGAIEFETRVQAMASALEHSEREDEDCVWDPEEGDK